MGTATLCFSVDVWADGLVKVRARTLFFSGYLTSNTRNVTNVFGRKAFLEGAALHDETRLAKLRDLARPYDVRVPGLMDGEIGCALHPARVLWRA